MATTDAAVLTLVLCTSCLTAVHVTPLNVKAGAKYMTEAHHLSL